MPNPVPGVTDFSRSIMNYQVSYEAYQADIKRFFSKNDKIQIAAKK